MVRTNINLETLNERLQFVNISLLGRSEKHKSWKWKKRRHITSDVTALISEQFSESKSDHKFCAKLGICGLQSCLHSKNGAKTAILGVPKMALRVPESKF